MITPTSSLSDCNGAERVARSLVGIRRSAIAPDPVAAATASSISIPGSLGSPAGAGSLISSVTGGSALPATLTVERWACAAADPETAINIAPVANSVSIAAR